ncbi:PepSY-like domain-containing protein [Aequorivita capsosiphonis]|uniref:PepSY-like domain-containing protein n=1 Tax=Aequorivita capsosiphonis TaxID=487317 RepID=UPI00040E4D51|nr:PepSY-like domain-containing protein [Aequorivita capsosiphonis]
MKTVKTLMLLLFVTTIAVAQDLNPSELPETVKNAFLKDYSKATDVEWERDMENYKVEFDMERMEQEIWYTASGEVIKKEQDITEADLPQGIRDAIKSKYPDYRVDDVEMTWQDGKTTYEVELEKGKEEWKIVYDSNGNVLQERRD